MGCGVGHGVWFWLGEAGGGVGGFVGAWVAVGSMGVGWDCTLSWLAGWVGTVSGGGVTALSLLPHAIASIRMAMVAISSARGVCFFISFLSWDVVAREAGYGLDEVLFVDVGAVFLLTLLSCFHVVKVLSEHDL